LVKKSVRKLGVENSAKKPRGKGRPFLPGNKAGFQPGESGNPGGRPKMLMDAYKEKLAEQVESQPEVTYAQAIARAVVILALNGNLQAVSELRSATERAERPGGGRMVEMSDDELLAIISRGGGGTVTPSPGA
jgi:hypothetical protein